MTYDLAVDLGSHLILNDPGELNLDLLLSEPWPKAPDPDQRPRAMLIRAFRGTWRDPAAAFYIDEALRLGLDFGLWLVLSPYEPIGAQLAAWRALPGDLGQFPLTVDYEPWGGGGIPTGTALLEAVRWCEERQDQAAMIYSRYLVVDTYLNGISTAELNARWWWLAQYFSLQTIRGEYPPEQMTVPKRVNRERIIWLQTADRLPPAGGRATLPNASAMDRDRWVGTMSYDDFLGDPPQPPQLSDRERIARLELEARSRGWDV
jgi:hypothetical protein